MHSKSTIQEKPSSASQVLEGSLHDLETTAGKRVHMIRIPDQRPENK